MCKTTNLLAKIITNMSDTTAPVYAHRCIFTHSTVENPEICLACPHIYVKHKILL
jgi:hypothetical protein